VSSVRPEDSRTCFPVPWRAGAWTRASTEAFDIVVVGGGITGAGIARDAALRALRVAVFDRADFASGTSSRSSRLVHGGVRYLEHGHLHLVLESSRERRRLLRMAPHLVRPLAFTWPVYAGARIPLWKVAGGLTLYDALALFRNVASHKRLAPDEVINAEPRLRSDRLRGGARYYDAAVDDARLVLANIVAAAEQGAVALNYAAVERVSEANGAWKVAVRDAITGLTHQCRTRAVVFALGPWSDEVPQIIGHDAPRSRVVGSLGAHIALDRRRVGNAGAVTLLAPIDGRVFFVLPANDLTIATTTETPAPASPGEVRASLADVQYLLTAVNHYFPAAQVRPDDVVAAWAGVRPLAAPNARRDLTSASREHAISEVRPSLFVVTGGKLTTYRAMAEDVVNRLAASLGARYRRAVTHRVPLPGGDFRDVPRAIESVVSVVGDRAVAERLVGAYGTRWPTVWERVQQGAGQDARLAHRLTLERPYLAAEVLHSVEREFAVTLADVLIRRVPIAFEERDHGAAAAAHIAKVLAPHFGWSFAESTNALRDYERAAQHQFTVE
jgi:glycerol-3-phosphate dehydrogenase